MRFPWSKKTTPDPLIVKGKEAEELFKTRDSDPEILTLSGGSQIAANQVFRSIPGILIVVQGNNLLVYGDYSSMSPELREESKEMGVFAETISAGFNPAKGVWPFIGTYHGKTVETGRGGSEIQRKLMLVAFEKACVLLRAEKESEDQRHQAYDTRRDVFVEKLLDEVSRG